MRHALPVDRIIKMYIDERMSTGDISNIFGVTPKVIVKRIKEAGMPIRSASDSGRLAHANGKFVRAGGRGPNWQGGRKLHQGYVMVYVGKRSRSKDKNFHTEYEREHRLVMEKHIGRKLTKDEIVHHINGIKDDNRIENLSVVLRKTHHGSVCCPRCQFNFKIK
jgi:hypothetical protein